MKILSYILMAWAISTGLNIIVFQTINYITEDEAYIDRSELKAACTGPACTVVFIVVAILYSIWGLVILLTKGITKLALLLESIFTKRKK